MGVELLFRIAGIGILVMVLVLMLKQSGRDEIATLVIIAGLVVTLLMVINQIDTLFDNVRKIFQLY